MKGFLRRTLAIARTESRYLLREPRTLVVSFLEPVILLVIYGFCVSFTMVNVPFAVWDQDRTAPARRLVRRLDAGDEQRTFRFVGYVSDPDQIQSLLSSGRVRFVLVIPTTFGREVGAGRPVTVQALFDGADSNTAGVTAGFLSAAIAQQNATLATETVARRSGSSPTGVSAPPIGGQPAVSDTVSLIWRVFYNPDLSTRRFIIPGLMVLLLSILAAMLTSTCITRERELGSLESLLVSPVSPREVVLGKMTPYFIISFVNVVIVLVLGGWAFGIWPRGSVLTLGVLTLFFLPGILALGMMISAVNKTQQLALVVATLTTYLPTMLLTGFAFPRSNMARFIYLVTWPYPANHYLHGVRVVYLKGGGLDVLWLETLWLAISGIALLALSIRIVGNQLKRGLG
jgi:ABC-2 type transport system permease protein